MNEVIVSYVTGMQINSLFVGTLMGITNTLATIPGMTTMSVVGAFTYNNVSTTQVCGIWLIIIKAYFSISVT